MAKRFIDTGLFDDEWFSELDNECKIFWIYYLTKCDHAGLLKYNKKLIEFQTGVNSLGRVIELLGNRLVRVTEVLLFCPKFIEYQYPGFPKSGVKQQESAIKLLIAAGLWDSVKGCFILLGNSPPTVSKVLTKTYVSDNVIVNDNVNDNDIDNRIKRAFDEIYIGSIRNSWSHVDFQFELKTFCEKVRGSPSVYENHTPDKLRLALQSQLRFCKSKPPKVNTFQQ